MIYMEELQSIASTTVEDIEDLFKDSGVDLSEVQVDTLYDELVPLLEKLAGYPDYRNYN